MSDPNPKDCGEQIGGLADTLTSQLPVAVEKLSVAAEEVKADRRERREFEHLVRNAMKIMAASAAIFLVLSVLIAVGVWNIIGGRNATRSIIKDTASVAQFVADCTDPEGECYKRNQEEDDEFLARLIAAVLEGDKELNTCLRYVPDDLAEYDECAKDAIRATLDSLTSPRVG